MAEFKKSGQLQELIETWLEASKKQEEKRVNIEALNETQQVLLAKKTGDLQEVINQYAENPSEELEAQLTELEKEVAQLQAKVAGSSNRSSMVFTSDTSAVQSLKSQIDTLAKAEYLAYYNANKDALYTKIGEAKTAYLDAMAELYDLRVSTNREYSFLTGKNAIVGLHEPDFFFVTGTYRPLAVTPYEINEALKEGKSKDNWDRPYINKLNN